MRLNRYAAGKTLTFRLFALFSCIFLWQCSYFSATPPQDRRFDRPAAPSAMQYPDLRRATAPNAVESGRPTPYGHGVSGESTRSANPAYDRTGVNEDPFFDRKLPSSAGGTYMHEPAETFNVALIVPLSGQYAALGRQMLQAAQLAMFNLRDPAVNLMPLDGAGDPVTSGKMVAEAKKRDADVILGPIFSHVTQAVATAARNSRIPVISFSNDVSVTRGGAYAFGILPQTQYERLTQFALSQRIRDFALLAPNNVYGGTALTTARTMLQKQPDVSFSRIELYRDDQYLTPERLRDHIDAAAGPLLKGNAAYSALILPETSPRLLEILRIAKNLPGFSEKVQVIGDAGWTQNPEIMRAPELSDAWIAMPPQDKQLAFERQFVATYRRPPGKLATLAYDGVTMIAALAKTAGNKVITDADIQRAAGFDGITGVYKFLPNKRVLRNLAIYRIDNSGNLIMLDRPETSF